MPGRSPSVKFGTVSNIQDFSTCQPDLIGISYMLDVKIGRTVEKLFKGDFSRKFPARSPTMEFWNFWCLHFVSLVGMNRSIYYLWKSVERLRSYSSGDFSRKCPACSIRMKFLNVIFWFPLLWWSDKCIICENRSKGWTVIQRVIFGQFPGCSPKTKFGKSIGVFQVWIGWTGEKLLNSVFWLWNPHWGRFPPKMTCRTKFCWPLRAGPLWSADAEFWSVTSSSEHNELCWVWFWSVKGFLICKGSMLTYCHLLTDPSLQPC
jgi:hypothetical protein